MMDELALNKYNFKDSYFISYLLEKIEVQNNWIVKFFDFFEFKIDLLINLVFKTYYKAKFVPYID